MRIKKLISEVKSSNLDNLYWYDMKLVDAIRFRGILKVLLANLFNNVQDSVAGSYDIVNLYKGDPVGDGIHQSGATVWNCVNLKNEKISRDDPVCELLNQNSERISAELKQNLSTISEHPDNRDYAKGGEWSGVFLYGVGGKADPELVKIFPHTYHVLEQLPLCKKFGFVMFSRLKSGTHVLPHCGSSNLRFRYHLGIDIPEPDEVKIRVGNEWLQWQQNKTFGFDDSYEHEVKHDGKKDRIVLVVDVWNPRLSQQDISVLSDSVFKTFGKA